MDLSLLTTLKEKLQTAKQFSEICNFFFDHFGDHAEFMQFGEPTRNDEVEQVLHQLAAQIVKGTAALLTMRLIRLPEYGFIHGGVQINGRMGNVIYFEDLHMGMLTVCWSPPNTQYMRFRTTPVRPVPTPSAN